jgi:CheY-like chemotaxis protein
MDHMMPDMDGVETAHKIREMDGEYYQKVPIIALTANALSGAREMFMEEGLNDFIAKPIDMKELSDKILEWLPFELLEE